MQFAINARVRAAALAGAFVLSACAVGSSTEGAGGSTSGSGGTNDGSGGASSATGGKGGGTATGGAPGTGGAISGTGGTSKGGATGSGGTVSTGGTTGTGGSSSQGGATGTGGVEPGSGGAAGAGTAGHVGSGSGGLTGTGGLTGNGGAKGGSSGSGGVSATGGAPGTGGAKGGSSGTGGATGTGGSSVNCTGSLPSGGTTHSGNSQGTAAGLSWQLWMNGSGGTITTYSTPAFSANWTGSSGDFLARIGMSWGNGKAYTSLGTVKADFAETKSGSAGNYSYIGIYGWSVNPCVEWYIVDDAYGNLPFNPGGSMVGTATIDGGTYNIIARSTTGTGGNRCGNVSSWNQIYSMRTSKRSCGTISITDHWNAWAKANQQLGAMLEASILIEAGGGTGSISFPTANVTAQ